MRAAEILGVDDIRFIEPDFAALNDSRYNVALAATKSDEGRLLLDEHEDPVALAFHGPDGWVAASFLCRNPSVALIDLFESLNGELFQEDRSVWAAAVREYFSTDLVSHVPPSMDDLNPKRYGILKNFITGIWGTGNNETCIDCCCGSGVGSLVLRDLGFIPLSFDNDESLLCRGLIEKRLQRKRRCGSMQPSRPGMLNPYKKGLRSSQASSTVSTRICGNGSSGNYARLPKKA